jgi:hypothetical protein
MASSSSASTPTAAATTPTDPAPTGRLAVLSAFAMAANALPLPIIPDYMVARVRGAMAHDTVTRHGLSLTKEARAIFESASSGSSVSARRAGEAVVRQVLKRLGPLAALTTVTRGLEVYALGKLLDRYIERVRTSGSVRIDVEEAKRVRDAIDRAVIRAISPALQPSAALLPRSVEDLRSQATRVVDAVILTSASLPGYIERRLDAAFDEVVSETPEIRNG